MTLEEAVTRLQYDYAGLEYQPDYTALQMAIEALEKQQPKYVRCKNGWQGMRYTRFQCPVCNKVVRTWGEEWCNGCGQRLKRPKQEIVNNQVVLVWDESTEGS